MNADWDLQPHLDVGYYKLALLLGFLPGWEQNRPGQSRKQARAWVLRIVANELLL